MYFAWCQRVAARFSLLTNYRSVYEQKMAASGRVHLQVLGTCTGDTFPSIMLFTDSKRYVFNCGEGVQRFCNEHRMRLTKTRHLFLTRATWNRIGGIPGLGLTLRDIGLGFQIHGPESIIDFVDAMQPFLMYKKDFQFLTDPIWSDTVHVDPCHDDEEMTVWPVVATGHLEPRDDDDSITSLDEDSNSEESSTERDAKRRRITAKRWKPWDVTVTYICKLKPVRGKFHPEKARALGVKTADFNILASGETLTLEDGQKIYPENCMDPPSPCPVFIIVECPTEEHLLELMDSELLKKYNTTDADDLKLVVHLTPHDIFSLPLYQHWISKFDSARHMIFNSSVCPQPVCYQRQAKLIAHFQAVDDKMFILPKQQLFTPIQLHDNCMPAEPLLKFNLRPEKAVSFDRTACLNDIDYDDIKNVTREIPNVKHMMNQVTTEDHLDSRCERDGIGIDIGPDAELVFLGTASMIPSKYRNVSAMLLRVNKDTSILLDCGEGTFGQLFRCYGVQLDEILTSIKCIFLSHFHPDHHLGIIQVLLEREKAFQRLGEAYKPATVLCPCSMRKWLINYAKYCQPFRFRLISCEETSKVDHEWTDVFQAFLGMIELRCVPVIHCCGAYGITMSHRDGWKFVYSGDTRPCPALIKAGMNATVVVHEATFSDHLQENAISCNHSTMSEAIRCGMDMKARHIILTHFSARYPKMPGLSDISRSHTAFAFDLMRIPLNQIDQAIRLVPMIDQIVKETDSEHAALDSNQTIML